MKRDILIPLLMMLLVCPCVRGMAQGTLEGRVTAADGQAVEFANVGVVSASRPYGAVTDRKGEYRLVVRERDSVTFRISCTGFETREFRLLLKGGEVRRLDCELKPSAKQLDEVVVSEDRTRSSTFTQIDLQRIENTVGPTEGVESLLKTLPDVSSNNELSSQYSVRGGSFDENLVYINGVEVYRPQLVRSGQQEGLSVVNPDMVDHLLFSPGGFDAAYGDRLSSVLDIVYSRPVERRFRLSASLLGGTASAQGRIGESFAYSLGLRHHSNRYLFKGMDTEGNYTSSYTDVQGVLNYRASDRLDVSFLGIATRNVYGLIPSSRTTTFGSFMESLELDVYFDGQEQDRYTTLLGAFTVDYHPTADFQLRWIASAQRNRERELYDLQNQYWLYEVGLDANAGDTSRFDRGVGTFLEHARNYLDIGLYSTEVRGVYYTGLGSWSFGVKGHLERVSDRMREWKWVDSAGYTFPTEHLMPGVDDTVVFNPVLQLFCNADNGLQTFRGTAFVQRELDFVTRRLSEFKVLAGLRGQYYHTVFEAPMDNGGRWFLSPRVSLNYKPEGQRDVLYRLAAGVYQQPYLYREMRRMDGTLRADLAPQCSYQATGTVDWNLTLWGKPFRLTTDLYYKYITHLVPYTIDNLRIRYNPDEEAVGYAAGASVRINGDFVPGLESWASLSFMQTQEDLLGDTLGWIARPTDQRFSFKLFLQDYLPAIPWWRMSLSFIYGTGTPVTFPYQRDRSVEYRLPAYFRVDWGNTVQLSRFAAVRRAPVLRAFDDILVGVEVFNLFNYRNVVSFIWVADYNNVYYPVPNYLTARQVNVKLTLTF